MKVQLAIYRPGEGWSPVAASREGGRRLVVAFGASEFGDTPEILSDIPSRFHADFALGCSTAGEIHGARIDDRTISAAVLDFAATGLRTARVDVSDPDRSRQAGEALARELADPALRGVMVLCDGLNIDGSYLVAGLSGSLPPNVVVTGGLAADGDRFQRTWVLDGAGVHSHRAAAIGYYGDAIRVGHGSKGGWDLFGPERRITRSRGKVLFELDGRPALELYREYLGDRASGLPGTGLLFPLALRSSADASEAPLVRSILGINEDEQSLTFAGDIPQGWLAMLMCANFDRIVDGASQAAMDSRSTISGSGDALAVTISCVGRRWVLGERAEEEVEATLDALPDPVAQIGFYSYGELTPNEGGPCRLHNQSMTLTTLSEAA